MTLSAAVRTFDFRQASASSDADAILAAFDHLTPGEALIVRAEAPPRELLRRLQAERKGLFEWSLVEEGPSGLSFEIARRTAAAGARREIAEALAWDHDRLDALEAAAFARLAQGDAEAARRAWGEFSAGLRRHIRFEEAILFPTFEERAGVPPDHGPTGVMRAEHREIESILEALSRAFLGVGAGAEPLRAELHAVLGPHNEKEEQVLYPMTDESLDPEERDALVARIQSQD